MSDIVNIDKISELRVSYKKPNYQLGISIQTRLINSKEWLHNAMNADIIEPTAMTLATVNNLGQPSLRNVLLKGISEKDLFSTPTTKAVKGVKLIQTTMLALTFLWKELERQVTINGQAEKISQKESEKYFKSRPIGHQISAWASTQSSKIPNREWMIEREQSMLSKFGTEKFHTLSFGEDSTLLLKKLSFGKDVKIVCMTEFNT